MRAKCAVVCWRLQDDNFVPTMTAQETLGFYASVLLPRGTSRAARDARIQQVLAAMGISHVKQTLVRLAAGCCLGHHGMFHVIGSCSKALCYYKQHCWPAALLRPCVSLQDCVGLGATTRILQPFIAIHV